MAKRLELLKHHLLPMQNPQFETLHIHRRPDQKPYLSKLDPLQFLLRSAMVYATNTAVIDGDRQLTYMDLAHRVRTLANVFISQYNIQQGERVGILCQNLIPNLEAQFAIPAIGAIMVPINTRLGMEEIEYIIQHAGISLLIVQSEWIERLSQTVLLSVKMIEVGHTASPYEQLLASHEPKLSWNDLPSVTDENETISINYTSGSTGRPKGVMATYRGLYMMAIGMLIHSKLSSDTRFLWTLPMFHCNGWGFPWAIVAVGGTQLMLDKMDYTKIWELLRHHNINHYNGAPTVQLEICNHKDASRLPHPVTVFSGGSVLSATLVKQMKALNLIPTQVYGLTETYGPAVTSYDHSLLRNYTEEEQFKLLARPGFNIITSDEVRILDKQGVDVKPDGNTIGEICFTGNLVMKGYYNAPEETEKAFRGGYFWTGDLGVRHPDGSIEIVDRIKDIIISGGENISSLEVENVLIQLDEVLECTVVAGPDDKWGERPVAFVVVKKGNVLDEKTVIEHCKKLLAGYKCPSKVIFTETIPRTSTGK
ncbi:putative acyl-activating enzyme 1, peroxisomal [Choanephora cucurbitarum]|uniref:Putative acyl-activating enzyme 1, peroxisomal n=1 Tax=Choanephora cucurbitarum TaxID=101091 RepID=A0A1C7N824_9FUNG|nr:putative acyl-activating enzyme 1, peroxisomal [Choanephora cucurbitarum]